MTRKITKKIQIGSRVIGGGAPILVQSMTCTPTTDFEATLAQIRSLEDLEENALALGEEIDVLSDDLADVDFIEKVKTSF